MKDNKDQADRQVYRSPTAIVIWWLWVLFALANLIDLAVQGRDQLSLVAAFALVLITSIVYVSAQRPRVVADSTGLTIINPIRDHRVGWPAMAGADSTDLLRVRCEWPEDETPEAENAENTAPRGVPTRKRVIYAWAVHASRRHQFATEMRAKRQAQRGGRRGFSSFAGGGFGAAAFGGGGRGYSSTPDTPEHDPLTLDANKIAASLTERAEQARAQQPGVRAVAPVATWYWPAVAAILVPGLALLIVALT